MLGETEVTKGLALLLTEVTYKPLPIAAASERLFFSANCDVGLNNQL